MSDKLIRVLMITACLSLYLLGLFVIWIANYGLFIQNLFLLMFIVPGWTIACLLIYDAVVSLYDYLDEDEEEQDELESDDRDIL